MDMADRDVRASRVMRTAESGEQFIPDTRAG
jgi:hypothetical protein